MPHVNDPRPTSNRVTRQQRRALERKDRKRSRRVSDLAAGAALMLGAAGMGTAANAATITVNSNLDTVAVDGQCTIREALINANDPTGTDQTGGDCAPGSIGLDVVSLSSVSGTITLANGSLQAYDSVVIQGPGPSNLTIDGAVSNTILYANGPAPTNIDVTVTGLTMQNGRGGVAARVTNLTLDNDVIQQNTSTYGAGAGVRFDSQYGGDLTITNTTISGNTTNNSSSFIPAYGGGIAIKYASSGATILLDHVTISGNQARDEGGGISARLSCGASMTIQNSVITGNEAGLIDGQGGYFYGSGGGVFIRNQAYVAAPSPMTTGVPAKNARAAKLPPGRGNGICGFVVIQDSTVSGNSADGNGGGIEAGFYSNLSIQRTTVSGNTAFRNGGGVSGDYGSALTMANSTVANNIAGYYGGGIFLYASSGRMNNITVNGNSSTAGYAGAGIYVGSPDYGGRPSYLNNSIVANNGSADIYVYTGFGASLTVSFSDVQNPGGTPTYIDAGGNISVDPLLGPLQDNGGPTQGNGNTNPTLTEMPGAPVVDLGDSATAALPTDQRGLPRIQGAAVDMGSVEAVAGTLQFSATAYAGAEGNFATVTVTRTGGSDTTATVNVTVTGGTATGGGVDYTFAGTTLTFNPGVLTQSFNIPLSADAVFDPNETIDLALQGPTGGATLGTPSTATVTIAEVGTPGTISAAGVTVNESDGVATITLNRAGGSAGPVTVNYSTTPGTATAGADYTAVTGSVSWADGDVAPKTFTIPITIDSVFEPPETFTVNLSTPTPGAVVSTPTVTVTILDTAAPVPTLAFWMKLMLALTCAGVGIVMLKNGRMLVIVVATGVALAAAPPLHAASQQPKAGAVRQHRAPRVAGTITQVLPSGSSIVLKIGNDTLTVLPGQLRIVDMRGKQRHRVRPDALAAGLPVAYSVKRGPNGAIRHVNIVLFDTLDHAKKAATAKR